MKEYPAIAGSGGQDFREFDAYVFDKKDGSNLRMQLSPKRGIYKFGTRHRMFDKTDPVFGSAVDLAKSMWENIFLKLAKDNKWESVIFFCEFHGPNSFAGKHDEADNKTLTLFDFAPHKKGILGPREYLKLTETFDHANTAKLIGNYHWTRGFVQQVRNNEIPGVTFEGVVGKAGSGHKLVMAKAKTAAWIDKVKALYPRDEADKLINS